MDQPDFFPIPSPYVGVRKTNAKNYYKGCLRSREERLCWHQMTNNQKRQVMCLLALRKTKVRDRKTGKPDMGEQPVQNLPDL